MNITQLSIEKNRIAFFLLAAVIAAGLMSYQSLSRDSMPPYTVRVATVVSQFPGASPERVELLVTEQIEEVAQELPELKEVTSTSRTGLSIVSVELKDDVAPEDLQNVWDRLRRKLDSIDSLPEAVVPELNDDGIGEVYGIVLTLTTDGFSYAETKDYADDIRNDLIKLGSAAKVEFGGVQEERIFIEFDIAQLSEYNISGTQLQTILQSTNTLSSGGQINLGSERIILEPTGSFNSIQDIENTLVPLGESNQLVSLGDITNIRRGYVEPFDQLVRANGKQAISLHVNLKEGENITKLGEEVNTLISYWQEILPIGLELERSVSMDAYIEDKVSNFIGNLIQAIAIILIVMLFFLGLRTGIIISSLIPAVTIMTLMLMGLFNVGLNQVTLAALIMALGMMVDNAIVVAESIMVKIEQGIDAKKAAISSCGELLSPLLISTLTSCAAFLAFFLAESTMGDIVGPIFVVISLALLSSWLLSLSMIATLCYLFLHKRTVSDDKKSIVDRLVAQLKDVYKNVIIFSLTRKPVVITAAIGLFLIAIFGFRFIPFVFFPDSDRNLITMDINLAEGTRIERTLEVVSDIERYIADTLLANENNPRGITDWTSYIGEGPESYDTGYSPDEANDSYAHFLINTSSYEANNWLIAQLDQYTFENFPDATIVVAALGGGGTGVPIEIKISGDNPDILQQIAGTIKLQLLGVPNTKNVKDDWGPKSKKLVIDIDQARAQNAGVSSTDIATSLKTVLDGYETGEYREKNKSITMLMKSDTSDQQSLTSLETLNIFSQTTGAAVPLLQVADIVPQWQYAKIKRKDLKRTINVSSELTDAGNASAVMSSLTPWLEEQARQWPAGYTYNAGGDAQSTAENLGAVIKYLPLSGVIILFLLVFQFNSFRKTALVLITIPLGLIGVSFGLLLLREPFGFMPFLGVISLAGIVINNAIVLLDRIDFELEANSRNTQDALVAACLQRFRPILLATFTTILGMIPLYLSGGEMWQGMAVCIMFGLLFGTLITLILIPTAYSIFYRVNYSNYELDPQVLNT